MLFSKITTTDEVKKRVGDIALSADLIKTLKDKKAHSHEESLCGRFLIAQLMKIEKNELESFLYQSLGSFRYKNSFWSLSHKGKFIVGVVGKEPIGIDIELNTPKDRILFDIFTDKEWKVLGRKCWKNFYIGWTAKEACLKKLSLGLSEINKISIVSRNSKGISMVYLNRKVTAQTILDRKFVVSISK